MTWQDFLYYLAFVLLACGFFGVLIGIHLWTTIKESDEE
jgi:hypothetical protein